MLLSDFAVKRPVAACVLNLLLLLVGILAFQELPLREYPDVSAPVITIKADYQGASANIMESRVAKVIEDQLSGLEGVRAIDSSSTDGRTRIKIEFDSCRDIDVAANDVRDAVAKSERQLPDTMKAPAVEKSDADGDGVITFSVSDNNLSLVELSDYVHRKLLDPLSLISGVSSVELKGYHDYALLVRLNPVAMASHNVTVTDIEQALKEENLEAPVGKIGNIAKSYTLRLMRSYSTVDDYQQLVIRRNLDGSLLYLSDIATVETGAKGGEKHFLVNGKPAVGLEFIKQPQANTLDVVQSIRSEVDRLEPFLPEGMDIMPLSDSSVYIKQAISQVYSTLAITIALVISVVFLFLGSARAALLPAVSIPVSLLAAFAAMQWFGCSINLITLLALVLAVGLLVDDAIVVLENIHARITSGEPPALAAYRGTREVGRAVMTTTIVLVAVFAPIAFLSGSVGLIFREYGVALAASVIASSIVALTMGQIIGSRLVPANNPPGSFSVWAERQLTWLETLYRRMLGKSFAFKSLPLLMILTSIAAISLMFYQLPRSFLPQEDHGRLYVKLSAAEGTSYQAMAVLIRAVNERLQPLMGKGGAIQTVALSTPTGGVESDMKLTIDLKPWDERKLSVYQVASQLRKLLKTLPELKGSPVVPSSFSTKARAPVQLVIGGGSYQDVKSWVDVLYQKAVTNPGLLDIDIDYDETTPRMLVTTNRTYASELGISVSDIASALETLLAGKDITTFIERGEEYDVNVQAPLSAFNTQRDLAKIHLRTRSGQLVSLDSLLSVVIEGQPEALRHYNRRKSITLSANLAPGYSLGEALGYLQQLAVDNLPAQATVNYKGDSLAFIRSGSSMNMLFVLAMIVVYLVLAAQFESFIHPFVIILSVPLALTGAFAGMLIFGLELNIYTQISLVMLIGLAAKNSILIVEFINQLRDRNIDFDQAVLEGATLRMRAVLMTAVTTLAGAVPLIMASGAGSESRSMIGIVIFSGVLVSTIMTLLVIPACYRLVARQTRLSNEASVRLHEACELFPEKR